jgi:uracil-DNA glycosylase
MSEIRLDESWFEVLKSEFRSAYFIDLKRFLKQEINAGKKVYPPGNQIFAALDACRFEDVKVVIIGQDPYHGPNQANGLCFSVHRSVSLPPSLKNIYQEMHSDLGVEIPKHGDLNSWAKQGVLLLNATLTVQANHAGSHQNKGWEKFTDRIISSLNHLRPQLVFMLWGGYAKRKGTIIDRNKHLVLESGHPSPLSANKGHWFGNQHFSKCNSYLVKAGQNPIDWGIDS